MRLSFFARLCKASTLTGGTLSIKDRKANVDGELEVYVKHQNKDVTPGSSIGPPALLFDGTFNL